MIKVSINKKKRTCLQLDFAILADHRVEMKESKITDKYLDLARELTELWNMKVTIIPIVVGSLETVHKGLERGLEEMEISKKFKISQTTALLKSAKILEKSGKPEETCCHPVFSENY